MLYSKIIRIALILFIPFFLSSCFEINEEVYLKKNGSGTYKFVMDMSKLKSMLELMQDKVNEKKKEKGEESGDADMISQSKEGMDKAVIEFNQMEGIKNAKSIGDEENLVFGFEFNFDNVDALNKAMRSRDKNNVNDDDYYTFEKGVFKKIASSGVEQLVNSIDKEGEDNQQAVQMLSSVNYSFTFRTEAKIKKFSNKKSELKNKKELVFNTTFSEIMDKKVDVNNEIKIK